MASVEVGSRSFDPPRESRLRVLAIDGGGIRGLIPALVLAELERAIEERSPGTTLAESFDLIAGTSTGGLIALGLTTPGDGGRPALDAASMVELYGGEEAREIFTRPTLERLPGVGELSNLLDPRYELDGLRRTLESRFGSRVVADALSGLLVAAYDMRAREPRFFKPWSAGADRITAVDAGLATSAAPTYFPALRHDGGALVDGGVFVNNPTIAAIVEALKRTEGEPIRTEDLLVVSLGTGRHERGFDPGEVAGWGALGWIAPAKGSEPPLIGAMLDGQSDAADHWAHILLNHRAGEAMAERLGAGPGYFRWQIDLPAPLPLDGVKPEQIERLRECGEALREGRAEEIAAIAEAVAPAG